MESIITTKGKSSLKSRFHNKEEHFLHVFIKCKIIKMFVVYSKMTFLKQPSVVSGVLTIDITVVVS